MTIIPGRGGVAGGGGGTSTVLGLPDPSEKYDGRVLINRVDRREYICENDPIVGTNATADFHNLRNNPENVNYYQERDADLRVFHDLPAASASDEDTWIYIDSGNHRDKFYFGDTAPGSSYHWYEDSPGDALFEVCRAFVDGDDAQISDLGLQAPVVYMGQRQNDTEARDWLHRHTVDLAKAYYVYWSLSENAFKIVNQYTAPGTVVNHWRWRNVRAEAINPIYRPNLDGSFFTPTVEDFEDNAVLTDWNGRNWHIKHEGHGAQSARGTWTDYAPGATVPGLRSAETYRGVVSNLSEVDSPAADDVAIVSDGRHTILYAYISGALTGWVRYNPLPWDRLLGPFNSLEDADGAVGTFTSGTNVFCVIGYRLYRLTAFTPGTAATHSYTWIPAIDATGRGAYLAFLDLETPTGANHNISQGANWTLQDTAPAGWSIEGDRLRSPTAPNLAAHVIGFWIEAWDGTTTLVNRVQYPFHRTTNRSGGTGNTTNMFNVDASQEARVAPNIHVAHQGYFEIEFFSASQASSVGERNRIGGGNLHIYEWVG